MNYRRLFRRGRRINSGLSMVPELRDCRCNDLFLRYWIHVRGELSIDRFSEIIGIPPATISAIERGERRVTSDHLDRLARIEKKSIAEVMRLIAEDASRLVQPTPKRRRQEAVVSGNNRRQ